MNTNGRKITAGQPAPQQAPVLGLKDMPAFACLPASSGTALCRHPRDSRMFGLSYTIAAAKRAAEWHRLSIEAWTYGVQDNSTAIPVMDFIFKPGGGGQIRTLTVRDLKIMSRPMTEDATTGARAMSVALFFIHQINAGQVPDCERILNLHRLYPDAEEECNHKNKAQETGEKHHG